MKPKILRSEEEYREALELVSTLMDAEPDSTEEEELELWSMLVEKYEEEHYPIDPPDPIEAIKFRMDQMGIKQKDLTKYIPAKSKVSEVLNRKRALSLSMIRALNRNLGIPLEVLIREVELVKTAASKKGATSTENAAKKRPSVRIMTIRKRLVTKQKPTRKTVKRSASHT